MVSKQNIFGNVIALKYLLTCPRYDKNVDIKLSAYDEFPD
jgi:hypothetical protein